MGSPIGIYVSTDPCQPVLNPVCLLQGQRAEQSPHLQVRKDQPWTPTGMGSGTGLVTSETTAFVCSSCVPLPLCTSGTSPQFLPALTHACERTSE